MRQREGEGSFVAQLQQVALAADARKHTLARRSAAWLKLSNRAATVRVLSESQTNSEQRCTKACTKAKIIPKHRVRKLVRKLK